MPRTDGIGVVPSEDNGRPPNGAFAHRPPQPALGNDGGKGKSTSTHIGHLLLPMPTNRRFSPMEAQFITEFLKDPAALPKDIALRAGYSPNSAAQQASQILRKKHVLAEIEDQMHAFVQRERLSIQRLVRHLIELAEVDKREFYNEDGSLKTPQEWTSTQAALVKGMSISEIWDTPGSPNKIQVGELKKITFTDHLEPIKMLTKSLQGFIDTMRVKSQSVNVHEHNHTINPANSEIDFSVLTEDELMVLKGLYDKARDLTKTKLVNSRSQIAGRA